MADTSRDVLFFSNPSANGYAKRVALVSIGLIYFFAFCYGTDNARYTGGNYEGFLGWLIFQSIVGVLFYFYSSKSRELPLASWGGMNDNSYDLPNIAKFIFYAGLFGPAVAIAELIDKFYRIYLLLTGQSAEEFEIKTFKEKLEDFGKKMRLENNLDEGTEMSYFFGRLKYKRPEKVSMFSSGDTLSNQVFISALIFLTCLIVPIFITVGRGQDLNDLNQYVSNISYSVAFFSAFILVFILGTVRSTSVNTGGAVLGQGDSLNTDLRTPPS